MREFFDKNDAEITAFSKLRTFADSERYLLERPHLCCEWTSNRITIDALNAGITQKEKTLLTVGGVRGATNLLDVQVARQVVTLQYLLELAATLKANPSSPSLIEGFFRK